jgi:hypothetical protein
VLGSGIGFEVRGGEHRLEGRGEERRTKRQL